MADASRQIAFEQTGLPSVLKNYHLAVPPNQREYSWTDREVTQLLQDLTKAVSDGADSFSRIVTIPRGKDDLEVVDGQQRLATTAMLLAAIRDYLRDTGDQSMTVEMITNYFLTGIDLRQDARVARLRLNVDDNDLFSWIVTGNKNDTQPAKQRISHERMLVAYKLCAEHVRQIVAPLQPTERANLLKAWLSFLEHNSLIVLLRVPDDADAYKMFETLNDRGLRTSQADLIKNYTCLAAQAAVFRKCKHAGVQCAGLWSQ